MGPSFLLGALNKKGDKGIWLDQNFRKDLSQQSELLITTQQRWGNNYKTLFSVQYEGTLMYHVPLKNKEIIKVFSLGGGFNATKDLKTPPGSYLQWVWESRYLYQMHWTMPLFKGDIIQTIRMEYRELHHGKLSSYGLLRYRFRFDLPWKWTKYKLHPWVSNEWFFRENTFDPATGIGNVGGWSQDRVRVGVTASFFNGKLLSAVYYQWRYQRNAPGSESEWNHTSQLGLSATLQF